MHTSKRFTYQNKTRVMWLTDLLWIMAVIISLSACGNNSGAAVSPSASTTKVLVVNASPDVGPISLYVGSTQIGSTFFKYPYPSSYYALGSGLQNLQVRNTKYATIAAFSPTLANNTNYTMFMMGLNSATVKADTLVPLFTADTASAPPLGYGKIRFVNASPRTPGLDVTANGTIAFSNIAYKGLSTYQQVPAGIYDFKVYATGSTTGVLVDVPLITIQDGRLYTLFTYGLTGRTDTAAIGAKVITNK